MRPATAMTADEDRPQSLLSRLALADAWTTPNRAADAPAAVSNARTITLQKDMRGEPMPEPKANILIVDDMPDKLLVYRTVLEELGQNVVACRSGADALKEVLREDFAVILLDVNMPSIDGFETAALIRQRKRSAHTPIIFLTSFIDEVSIQQGYATGGVDYIPAPVIPEILRAKVRVFVELYQMRRQVEYQALERAQRAAAEEAARRSSFLAEASRALTMTLDVEGLLGILVGLPIPQLSDVSLVTLARENGDAERTLACWLDHPRAEPLQGEIAELPPELRTMIRGVLTSGAGDVMFHSTPVPRPLAAPDGRGPGEELMSVIILPLVARGRILGAYTFGNRPSRSDLSPADVWLAEDLARRGAVALDNAMLVRDIQEADRRKNEFLAMLAHELRNPLAPIRNAVHVLRDPRAEDVGWARDIIDRQVSNLVRMVNDLLDVARINQGKIQLVVDALDVNAALAAAVETSRPTIEAHGHTLEVVPAAGPITVAGDSARLSQIFSNLLNNAAKYTPRGGRITIGAQQEDNEVVIRVRDNGRGIAPDLLDKVFDLFIQGNQSLDRAEGGLGIGLTLVRRLVEMHRGTVEAVSEGLGKGSEFVVRLPAEAAVAPTPVEPGSPGKSAMPLRILVVDDNRDVAESLATVLRLHSHEVCLAGDGIAALRASEKFDPHVILLDIGLPLLNGYETATRLRAAGPPSLQLLIAISGYGQEKDIRRSMEAGFDQHLIKPVAPEVLTRIIAGVAPGAPAIL